MTSKEAVEACREQGIELFLADGRVRYRCPRGCLTPELREALISRRDEVLALLQLPPSHTASNWTRWEAVRWPERCLQSERLFGQQRHARLFPLLPDPYRGGATSGRVRTSRGLGQLLQVFADRVTVALDAGPKGKVVFLQPWDVVPYEEVSGVGTS
jgi:hypothetical protein